jgi:type VI protein secretion system component VasF
MEVYGNVQQNTDLVSVVYKWLPVWLSGAAALVALFASYSGIQMRLALLEQKQQHLINVVERLDNKVENIIRP